MHFLINQLHESVKILEESKDVDIHRKRNPIRAPAVGENAQPRLKARLKILPMWRIWKEGSMKKKISDEVRMVLTQDRPYISDRGARKRGCCQTGQQRLRPEDEIK